jgi:hypothetical protein
MRTAKIEIKVSEPKENLPQDQWQRITRAANMLRANDFDVDIIWEARPVQKKAHLPETAYHS